MPFAQGPETHAVSPAPLLGPSSFGSPTSPSLPFADKSLPLLRLRLCLHAAPQPPYALLDEAFRVSSRIFILEWRLPERNLDYPAHSLIRLRAALAGQHRSFAAFMRLGGLEGILQRYSLYRQQQGRSPCVLRRRRACGPCGQMTLAEALDNSDTAGSCLGV